MMKFSRIMLLNYSCNLLPHFLSIPFYCLMWKEVVDKAVSDLHLKPNNAIDCSKWRELIRRNWSDSCSDNDAVS